MMHGKNEDLTSLDLTSVHSVTSKVCGSYQDHGTSGFDMIFHGKLELKKATGEVVASKSIKELVGTFTIFTSPSREKFRDI